MSPYCNTRSHNSVKCPFVLATGSGEALADAYLLALETQAVALAHSEQGRLLHVKSSHALHTMETGYFRL